MVHDQDAHLHRLRRWRSPSPPGLTLREAEGFDLRRFFLQSVERPHKQLAAVGPIWAELVPAHLRDRAVLVSFARQILTVHVPDSSTLYQLDRLLRSGLERDLRTRCRAPLRRVQVRVATPAAETHDAPPPD